MSNNQMSNLPSENTPDAVRAAVLAQVNTAKVSLSGPVTDLAAILNDISPQGTEAKMREFVDRTIVVHAISPFMGAYGPAAFCIITDADNDVLYHFVVGAKVVLPKFLMAMDHLPFRCTVREREGGMYGTYLDVE